MDSGYLAALAERVLVFDGAMGTELMAMELADADFGGSRQRGCNEAVVLFRPDVIEAIHERYLEAGADVLETDSFTASRLKLDEYGLGDRTVELNRRSAEIAKAAARRFSTPERPRFVAGSLGPTGMLISSSDPASRRSPSTNSPRSTRNRPRRWSRAAPTSCCWKRARICSR